MDGMPVLILVVILAIVLFVTLFLIGTWLKGRMKSAAQKVEEDYAGEGIIRMDGANFFGRKSLGMGQVRGNGILALTRMRLVFRMLMPDRTHEIRLESVGDIEHPMAFLGKTKGMRLLVINFTNDEGEQDAMGWAVRDPDGWADAIRSAMKSR
jgi:hypothetical protein